MPRKLAVVAAGLTATLAFAGTAYARSYDLVQSDVRVQAGTPDVKVEENITVAFSGAYTFGFRDIPLRDGETIDGISVAEGAREYGPGAPTALEPGGPPNTFGTERLGNKVRIVWRFQAADESRTFTLRYGIRGLAVAYDDVVDVNLKVWGDEWEQSLGRLTATMTGPGNVVRAWGHPVWVRGDVTIEGDRALLRALDVAAGQFVELRALYPRNAFPSTAGMRVVEGNGLGKISDEEQADAAAYERDHDRIEDAIRHPWRPGLVLLALGTIPAFLLAGLVFWRFGREQRTGYDREYEQEPPTETQPALVPVLLRQGGGAGSFEFTATLFDLIRRGFYRSAPTTTERSLWGGLRSELVSDLELTAGDQKQELTPWERNVADVVDSVLDGESERLSRFREEIEDEREEMSERFTAFRESVDTEVGNRRWFVSLGLVPLVVGLLAFAGLGLLLAYLAIDGWRSVYPRWSDVVLLALSVCSFLNAAMLAGALTRRKLWRRRTRAAEVEAERWDAFRRYLTDFPRLDEAPPASLALWERFLVYGIAFGIADRVLQAAHLHMPEELAKASTDLLDLAERRSRLRRELDVDRRSLLGVRVGARTAVLGLGRLRRRLLGRRRRWWRRRRRRLRLSPLDELGLVLAAPQASPGDELHSRSHDEHLAQPLADRVRERAVVRDPSRELDAHGKRRLLLHPGRLGLDEDVTADVRRKRAHDLPDRRGEDVHSPDDEHVVRSPDATHPWCGPAARAGARPHLHVIAGAKPQERRSAMLEMRQDELAGGAVLHRERVPGLGIDQLGVDEAARAEMHSVLLLALPEERDADVADAHRLEDPRAPALLELGAKRRLAAPGLARHEDALDTGLAQVEVLGQVRGI